jgi:type IV pilus assembly protein PilM
MFFSPKKVVGVDIGSSSIKLVQLSRTRKGYHLEGLGIAPSPKDSVLDGDIFNVGAISNVLRELVSASNVRGCDAYAGLFGPGAVIKRIKIPTMSPSELKNNIRWEAEQYIPFNIDDVNLDYDVITPNYKRGGTMDLVIAAAKKDLVSSYSASLYDAGLSVGGIDIGALALYDMYKENFPEETEEACIIIDVGSTRTVVNIIEKGRSVFVKDVNIGGDHFTKKIQEGLGVTFEEGEALKVGAEETGLPPEVEKIILAETKKLGIEIRKVLDLYLATASEMPLGDIGIVGGSTKLVGMANVLEASTGLPVEVINPLKKIIFNEKIFPVSYIAQIAPFFGVTVGLAIRGLRY